MPRITKYDLKNARIALEAVTESKFHIRYAEENKVFLVEDVEPDLERKVSYEMDKAEMLVFLDAYGRGFVRGAKG